MNIPKKPVRTEAGASRGNVTTYIVGFILSLQLTLIAYFLVANQILAGRGLILAIIGLAVTQLMVQLVFFLHLDRESRPRWNFVVFLFMLLVLLILVLGTLWIMHNLDYHAAPTGDVDQYLLQEEGIER